MKKGFVIEDYSFRTGELIGTSSKPYATRSAATEALTTDRGEQFELSGKLADFIGDDFFAHKIKNLEKEE